MSSFSFNDLEPEMSWIKGGPGVPAGGTPSRQSGGHRSPGGECFAPLSEINSSSHVILQHCASARTFELWRVPGASSNVPKSWNLWHSTSLTDHCNHLIFIYGFSGWPRCNPMKQIDNILYHTRREPKRTQISRDIDENPTHFYTWGTPSCRGRGVRSTLITGIHEKT